MIERLQISHLRNLSQVNLPATACNVIIGANGSGKTSLLEAIFLLSRGKRAKVKQHDSVQIGTIGSADTRTPIAAILALKHFNQMVEQVNEK